MSSHTNESATVGERRKRLLFIGILGYLFGYGTHSVVHCVSLMHMTPMPTIIAGSLAWLLFVLLVVAVRRGHRLAAQAEVFLGGVTLAGLFAVHLLPDWGPFSMPWWNSGTTVVMWLSLTAATIGSVIMIIAGWQARTAVR
ncbi:hypothetical protein [Nocardia tenerifensis]|uniref:hypothetical protein n=1 Tax=Nocardia tenerifensis TaxID=228006 RepID=UPI0011B43355|nr:hypothetical protein [Nocardia tenerifensis]